MLFSAIAVAYQTRKVFSNLFILFITISILILIQSYLLNNDIIDSIYMLIISILLIRAMVGRYVMAMRVVLYIAVVALLFLDSDLFLLEKYNIINIILDSIIVFIALVLFEIYEYSYYRINKTLDIAVPAMISMAIQGPYMFALPILQGFVFAVFDLPIYLYGPLAFLAYLFNYFFLISMFKINFIFLFVFINTFLFLITFFIFNKRIAYRSTSPPVGWLYSWLGNKYYVEDVVGVGGFSYVLRPGGGSG